MDERELAQMLADAVELQDSIPTGVLSTDYFAEQCAHHVLVLIDEVQRLKAAALVAADEPVYAE